MLFAQNDASKGPICNPIQELISAPPLLKQANKETEKKKKKNDHQQQKQNLPQVMLLQQTQEIVYSH